MPFDALVAPRRPQSLASLLAARGVVPVSEHSLAQHKRAQLEKFQPSFWHQHQTWLPVGLLGSVGCMAASGGLANGIVPGSSLPSVLTLGWMAVIGLLILFGVFRAHGGAFWEESWLPPGWISLRGVPEPIATLARQLQRELPGASLIIGELKQDEVVLDPYLLLEYDEEIVCLGIWDGDRIIDCACPSWPG